MSGSNGPTKAGGGSRDIPLRKLTSSRSMFNLHGAGAGESVQASNAVGESLSRATPAQTELVGRGFGELSR